MRPADVLFLAASCVFCWCIQSAHSGRSSAKGPLQAEDPNIFECGGSLSRNSRSIQIPSKYSHTNSMLRFHLTKDYQPPCSGELLGKRHLPSFFKKDVLETGEEFDGNTLFLSTGQLMVFNDTDFGIMYEPSEYCVLLGPEDVLEIQMCLVECRNKGEVGAGNNGVICIPKCCPPGQVVDYISQESNRSLCQPSGDLQWKPMFHKASTLDHMCLSPAVVSRTPAYRLMYPKKLCQGTLLFLPRLQPSVDGYAHWTRHRWRLLDDGTVVERRPRNPVTLGGRWQATSLYTCLDGLQNFGHGEFYRGDAFQDDQILIDCIPNEVAYQLSTDQAANLSSTNEVSMESSTDEAAIETSTEEMDSASTKATLITGILHTVILFGSIPFFGLTLYAYWLDWASQTIHGWTVVCHVFSHLLLDLFFGTSLALSLHSSFTSEFARLPEFCKFVGIMTHFFFLSTIFWLTVINLDLWLTFRKVRPSPSKWKQMKKFLVYCAVAVGFPLLILAVGLGLEMNFGPGSEHDDDCDIITPEYGTERCYLAKASEGVYLYFIVGALLGMNFILFAFLLRNLYSHKRSTGGRSLTGAATAASPELFIKLFIVMGTSFTLEFLFWCIESDAVGEEVSIMWILVDLLNFLVRPILVFYILGWKKLKNAWVPQDQADPHTNSTSTGQNMKMTSR